MTSRERVRKLLARQPVDRLPNGLGGCETAGLHSVAYHKLKRILGVNDPANRICTFMCNAIFEPPVLKALGGDVILLGSPRMCPSRFWGPNAASEWKPLSLWGTELQVPKQWQFRQEADGACWWDERFLCPAGGFFFDPPAPPAVESYFEQQEFPSLHFQPTHEISETLLRRLEEDAKWLYENTDYAIFCGETIQDLQLFPGGLQSWWMRMVEEPAACHDFLGQAVETSLAQLRQLDQAVGKYCETLLIADDMGDTRGVTIGPELWRKIYKPHYQRLFGEWHKISDLKVNLHCCGSISEILGDLIECGVDLYNPVQISANDMSPKALKEKFGNKIIFYGGVYDAVLLGRESSDEAVYEAVKANIRTFSRGGGYLFAGVHNLPPEMSEGHLKAMLQAYQDCCREPELVGGGIK